MGSRWIDTDAAYAVLTDYYHHTTDTQHAALREALGRVESVDAVPVIRCKDCRWRDNQDGFTAWMPCRALVTPNDFYCPRGERKDDDNG